MCKPDAAPHRAFGLAILAVVTALTVDAADEHRRAAEVLYLLQQSNRASAAMTQLTPQCRKMLTLICPQGNGYATEKLGDTRRGHGTPTTTSRH
jgi:hypothetical protein